MSLVLSLMYRGAEFQVSLSLSLSLSHSLSLSLYQAKQLLHASTFFTLFLTGFLLCIVGGIPGLSLSLSLSHSLSLSLSTRLSNFFMPVHFLLSF
jgi:hypothetical protein